MSVRSSQIHLDSANPQSTLRHARKGVLSAVAKRSSEVEAMCRLGSALDGEDRPEGYQLIECEDPNGSNSAAADFKSQAWLVFDIRAVPEFGPSIILGFSLGLAGIAGGAAYTVH